MGDRRQFGRRGALLLGGLVTACILATGASILLIPPRLVDHQDQVVFALNRHNIAYEQIILSQNRQDIQNSSAYPEYSFYGAEVVVRLRDARQVRGRIDCRFKDSRCSLYLASLGLPPEDLPELDTGEQWFWLDWLQEQLPKLGLIGGMYNDT
jgi:hypothetical protein